MYHPASGRSADEFLELYNVGGSTVDLRGWCVQGLAHCFESGLVIAPGSRRVLAHDRAAFRETYGVAADAEYAGELSDAGERLILRDAFGRIADDVTYDDGGAWPPTADGLKSSLERIDPTQDGSTPRNWRASLDPDGATPGRRNSREAPGLRPGIDDVRYAAEPSPGEPLEVTAAVEDASEVELTYVVDFGDEVDLTMVDEGPAEGEARGRRFRASVPGQPAGSLLRFRITAREAGRSTRFPRTDDTIDWAGTVVQDAGLVSELPVFHWFMERDGYSAALQHRYDDVLEPAVFYYDGVLYDNVSVRIRGQTARKRPKVNWKFQFPRGHDFYAPDLLDRPVDQFNLQASYADKSYLREVLAYETFREAGTPSNLAFHVRVQLNGEFFGLYTFLDAPDDDYLDRQGIDRSGAWYKAFDDCRLRGPDKLARRYQKMTLRDEDHSDLLEFLRKLNTLKGPARKRFLLDHVDIPGMVNYLAATKLIHSSDFYKKNYFLYRDTEGTGRWVMHPWDMDLTFGRAFHERVLNDIIWADRDGLPGRPHPTEPNQDRIWTRNRFVSALLEDGEIRRMFLRRLRTLMDELLAEPRYEERIAELVARIAPEAELDRLKWGQYGESQTLDEAVRILEERFLVPRRRHLFETHRAPGGIPPAASTERPIVISEIMLDPPGGAAARYVELHNPSPSVAVDLSGWRIDGLGLVLPGGTVLVPGGYLVVVADDVAFRAAYGGGVLVAAEYPGRLEHGGYLMLADGEGSVVDAVRYAAGPSRIAANGGRSLERTVTAPSTDFGEDWAPGAEPGGTPGRARG